MSDSGECADVRDEHHRVGGRLNEDHLRRSTHLGLDQRRIAHIDVLKVDAVAAVDVVRETYRPAVEILGQEHVVTGSAEGKDEIDRCHARGERPCAFAALKEGNCLLKVAAGRIRNAAVVVARALTECGMAKRRREIDGRGECARRVELVTAMHLSSVILHCISSHSSLYRLCPAQTGHGQSRPARCIAEPFWSFHYKHRQDTLSIKKYIKHT